MNVTNAEVEQTATAIRVQALAAKAVTTLTNAIAENTSSNNVICLQEMTVDTFTSVSSYENNRDVKDRAIKQAKKKGTHHTSAMVAIAVLDPERNRALWERTEKVTADQGIPHTLPFIKVDGHTRSYGWTTSDPKNTDKTLFDCPDYLLITVYRGMTDDQIHEIVHNYCDGVNKANNKELQQMGMKKVEFDPQSDFVKKDSWKTAFRTVDREYGKLSMEEVIKLCRVQLEAIDALKINTTNSTKRLSGVRAALIATYSENECDKWIAFWEDFFADEPQIKKVLTMLAKLGNLKTGNANGALDLCLKTFKQYQA
ncbi:hypothetical protein CH513_15385 [Salmonella enterica subsp. enterica serovar Infantis]|nr:hypothetical protein [Salmonella enterica subsp. enterica serovar Infantis]